MYVAPFAQNALLWFCVGESCHWHACFLCVSKAKVNLGSLTCLNWHTAPQIPASGIFGCFETFQYLSQCLSKGPKPGLEISQPSHFILTKQL